MSTAGLTLPRPFLPQRLRRPRRTALSLLVLGVCAAFMFVGGRTPPVVLWDESRIAVNALEMHLSGHVSLATTYGFAPDLWNTKPPLLIWLMDLSMSLFGVSEASMRLPSALAAMGTLALTLSFTRRVTGSFWTGALAAGLLAASIVFFGEHGARTADYEALLTLFTTGYLYVLFFALHRRRPGWRAPLLAGGLVALAVLTKSVAGLTAGVGVPVYLLAVGRWRRPFQAPWLLCALPAATLAPAAFYLLRAQGDPAYLQAVAHNDLSGRFSRALDRHSGPPWFYLRGLIALGGFAGGWLAALAVPALAWTRGRARLGLAYSLCVAAGLIGLLSFSATKLLHYAVPAIPFLAVATAIAARALLQALARRRGERGGLLPFRLAQVAVAAVLGLSLVQSVRFRTGWLPAHEFAPPALYGALIAAAGAQGAAPLALVDGGVTGQDVTAEGLAQDYAPQLDYYRELAVARGQRVARVAPSSLDRLASGAWVGTCDPRLAASVRALGPAHDAPAGCVLVARR